MKRNNSWNTREETSGMSNFSNSMEEFNVLRIFSARQQAIRLKWNTKITHVVSNNNMGRFVTAQQSVRIFSILPYYCQQKTFKERRTTECGVAALLGKSNRPKVVGPIPFLGVATGVMLMHDVLLQSLEIVFNRHKCGESRQIHRFIDRHLDYL